MNNLLLARPYLRLLTACSEMYASTEKLKLLKYTYTAPLASTATLGADLGVNTFNNSFLSDIDEGITLSNHKQEG